MGPLPAALEADATALVALLVLLLLVAIPIAIAQSAKIKKAWTDAAAELGLAFDGGAICGRCGDFDVSVERVTRGSGKSQRTFTRVALDGALPTEFKLGSEGFLVRALAPDVKVGDPAFDHDVRVRGESVDVVRAFDAQLRASLREAVAHGWTLSDGVLAAEVAGGLTDDLAPFVRSGLALAEKLAAITATVGPSLVARVHDDPFPEVRREAMRVLMTRRHGKRVLSEGLAFALVDPDPDNRFEAAQFAGDVPTLLALAYEGHAQSLRRLLRDAHEIAALRDVLAAWIRERGVFPTDRALAFAEALTAVPVDGAEGALAALLASEDAAVRLAAVRALGAIGTVAVVSALLPLRDKFLGGELKSAARDAILAIQARTAGAEAGALALATRAGGDLALAPTVESDPA